VSADPLKLSKRERQIMEIVYRLGEATALRVLAELPDPPSRTTVRTLLRILEDKGHLTHRTVEKEYVYKPATAKSRVGRRALRGLLSTFFGGSLERAVAAYLSDPDADLPPDERARLQAMIDQARQDNGV
jgi:predicted transcriptional regulator